MQIKKHLSIVAIISALFFSSPVIASSRIVEAENFCDVKHILSTIENPDQTLTVFDDDDTLSMMPCEGHSHCQFIGTPAWFDWQSQLPANDPQRVAPDFPGLIEASNSIIQRSKMEATDKNEMEVLQWMQSKSFHILVETARGPDLQRTTEKQLDSLGILPLLETTNTLDLRTKRKAELSNGILYVTGQDKGEMLKKLLNRTGQAYKTIVLIDDSLRNIQVFAQAFINDDVNVIAIHYKQLQNNRHSFPG